MSIAIIGATLELLDENNLKGFVGSLTIAETTFYYSLFSPMQITEHAEYVTTNSFTKFREVVELSVSVHDEVLVLDDEEWELFYGLVVASIQEVYNHESNVNKSCVVSNEVNQLFKLSRQIFFINESLRLITKPKFKCNILTEIKVRGKKVN